MHMSPLDSKTGQTEASPALSFEAAIADLEVVKAARCYLIEPRSPWVQHPKFLYQFSRSESNERIRARNSKRYDGDVAKKGWH